MVRARNIHPSLPERMKELSLLAQNLLLPSPTESGKDSRARESCRTLQGRDGKWQADQSLAADASYSRESPAFAGSRAREPEQDAAVRREAVAALTRTAIRAAVEHARRASAR